MRGVLKTLGEMRNWLIAFAMLVSASLCMAQGETENEEAEAESMEALIKRGVLDSLKFMATVNKDGSLNIVGLTSDGKFIKLENEKPTYEIVAPEKKPTYASRIVSATIGHEHRYNTYLSPLLHRGISLGVCAQTLRPNAFKCERLCTQSRNYMYAALNYGEYKGCLMYNFAEKFDFDFLYTFSPVGDLKIFAGGGLGLEAGADLHLSNSNNPTFARAKISFINLTVMPTFVARTPKREIVFRNQFAISMLGMAIAPEYTELYLDMIYPEGNYNGAICCTHIGNDIDISNHLQMVLPLKRNTIAMGCMVNRAKRKLNNNEFRDLTVAFTLGFAFDYQKSRGRLNQSQNAYNRK